MTGSACASASTVDAIYDRISPAVESALIATFKALGRTLPAPRRDPFYGLDRLDGPDLRLMEQMSAHGDFRKYVFVLDAGGGLGGLARWLTLTYGCRVLVLDVLAKVVAIGHRLTRRARLAGKISAVAASFEAIPIRDGTFTQIWSVEALHHAEDRRRAIGELFRVLRPGSTLALHEIVRRSESVPSIGGAWRHGTCADYLTLLAETGFTTIESEDVTHEAAEASVLTGSAHTAFLRVLDDADPREGDAWRQHQQEAQTIAATVRGPDYRVVQFFARRPSV